MIQPQTFSQERATGAELTGRAAEGQRLQALLENPRFPAALRPRIEALQRAITPVPTV